MEPASTWKISKEDPATPWCFILLILAFCVITVLNINTGNVHISLSEIADILLKKLDRYKRVQHYLKIRLPRILMAAILGGALSLSGFFAADLFENPIAGPFVLGISSGAKMVVALTMIIILEEQQMLLLIP